MANSDISNAVCFSTVLNSELDQIAEARKARSVELKVPTNGGPEQRARNAGLLGLAFSGGGIRSATFNLGVLQGLAGCKLLTQLDYLSTVSGGGYIGSWFISLIKQNGAEKQVEEAQKTLSPEQAAHPDRPDQLPISFLRQYSNYLTPRLAFYSADVWVMAATWFRNFILNLLLLISSIGVVLILPRLLGLLFEFDFTPRLSGWRDVPDAIGTVLFFTVAAVVLCLNLSRKLRSGQAGVQIGVVIPLLLGVLFLSRWLLFYPEFFARNTFWAGMWAPWAFFSCAFACIISYARFFRCFREEHPKRAAGTFQYWWTRVGAWALLFLAAIIPGFVVALLLWSIASGIESWFSTQVAWALLVWGPAVLLLVLSFGMTVLIGLLGLEFDARGREWLGRLRAWTLIYATGWMIVFGASIYGPLWIIKLFNAHPWTGMGLSAGWLGTTIAGVFSAKSDSTSGKPGAPGTNKGGGNPALEWIARIAPFVFMIGFVLAISTGIHVLLALGLPFSWNDEAHYFELLGGAANYLVGTNATRHFVSGGINLFVILLIAAGLLSLRLDINIFSLHEFYKNRLVRCYLGAIRCLRRRPDCFTGFDQNDDQRLINFRPSEDYYGPYPIINTTMNVSVGGNLAWQERKSVPFTFSPLYCGFNADQGNEAMRAGVAPREGSAAESPDGNSQDACVRPHRKASQFGYRNTEVFCYPRGVNLGTAVAVSGAAASPNQGYHTSTSVAFLMTVFDVRLGWWVGNPRRDDTYTHSSPRFNLITLGEELFGLSDANAGYVNLSDGGHFDNMGLYELVRRRCQYIIVSDAEQDADLTFASFTTAIRNCRTDFGVEIKIGLDRIGRKKDFSSAHCVVGTIQYPDDPKLGYLVYLKSSLTGDEPADVLGYHTAHAEFPHQTTADQWFTDSQFEAYRKLGQHVAETAFGAVRSPLADREAYFRELHRIWYPPSAHVQKFSGRHADRFADLTLALARQREFAFLDPQIFTGWEENTTDADAPAADAVYRYSALIEFMQTVYSDLNLESEDQQRHPHNQGWLTIFEHWVTQPGFKRTWEQTRDMYSEAFRNFYEDRVKKGKSGRAKAATP